MMITRRRKSQLENGMEEWMRKRLEMDAVSGILCGKTFFHCCILFEESCKKTIKPVCGVRYNHRTVNDMPTGTLSIHAEVDALETIKSKIRYRGDSPIYSIAVFRKNGLYSRPCESCIRYIAGNCCVRLKYVYYSSNDGIIREKVKDLISTI